MAGIFPKVHAANHFEQFQKIKVSVWFGQRENKKGFPLPNKLICIIFKSNTHTIKKIGFYKVAFLIKQHVKLNVVKIVQNES